MDLFCDISNCIGTGDLSSEICQAYLDQPAGSSYDHSDVLVPNIDCETLNEIIKTFRSCKQEDLEGENGLFLFRTKRGFVDQVFSHRVVAIIKRIFPVKFLIQ